MTSLPMTARQSPGRRPARRVALPLAGALLVLLLLTTAPAAFAGQATLFTITGHGWGHGIGMSQWGAYGYAKHGWTYEAILKHYYKGIAFGTVPDDPIRVRLRGGLSAVKLTCAKPYTASGTGVSFEIGAGVRATVTWLDGKYHVVAGDQAQDFSEPVTFTPSAGSLNLLTATDQGDTGLYRGTIRVLRPDGRLMIINKLPLESYLRGVVPHEVSATWPAESLKAQACAARAYAERSRNPKDSFDVYCTVRDQAYEGVGIEDGRTDAAVKATAGIVPTYKDDVIAAFYFSTSGGHTENIENSWQTVALPYLKGVPDPYDTYSPLHTWTPEQRTAASLARGLGASVSGTLRAIYPVQRGVSPRIVKAAIIGSAGVQFLHGSILRAKLGLKDSWANFRSMSVEPAAADRKSIAAGTSVTLKGRLYKAAPARATVTLHLRSKGAWHVRKVPVKPGKMSLGSGYSATFSSYSVTLKPSATTTYYFTYGKASSPRTKIVVTAGTPTPTPTPSPTPTPTPTPTASSSPATASPAPLLPVSPAPLLPVSPAP